MNQLGKQWKYINEGNLHIVLEIVNTDYVLRLIKEEEKSTTLTNVYYSVEFVNIVMTPLLLGTNYYQEVISIPKDEMVNLIEFLYDFRPEKRRFKTILCPYAVKTPNLTMISPLNDINYCVEIKPKEGFMSARFHKYSKCYYCLKQYLKLLHSDIESISKYCPLDLFSGDKIRMKYALQCLVHNPQNNFKLFQNGTLIYSEQTGNKKFCEIIKYISIFENSYQFFDFLVKVLLNDTNIQVESDNTLNKVEDNCVENCNLKNDCILYEILQLQKLANGFNIDASDFSIQGYNYVPLILDFVKARNYNLSQEPDKMLFLSQLDTKYLALISAVAKDCSIMISFSTTFQEGFPYIEIRNHKIPYKIAVTDLEPKAAQTLLKREKTEMKLIDIYEKHNHISVNHSKCKIQPHTETRAKQFEAWQQLIADYMKSTKQSTIDIRESQNIPLFNNTTIKRKLSEDSILTILEEMARTGKAAPVDKSKNVWEIYWHSLDEWGAMIYNWASDNGLNNSVCTLFELREGENTVDQEFHGLDMNVLLKALRSLETKGKCELMEFDDNQGVKFF